MKMLDMAIAELVQIPNAYDRVREAEQLDHALAAARGMVALIKRDAINSLRDHKTGYGSIAERLRLTKSRVQQIANTGGGTGPVAYAFRDEAGAWFGAPGLLESGHYVDALMPQPFDPPSRPDSKWAGQTLLVRYGRIPFDASVSTYGLTVLDHENPRRVRMTHQVMNVLFA